MRYKEILPAMRTAKVWGMQSYCSRLKVGSVIYKDRIISHGYNGTPRGELNVCEGLDGNTLPYVRHAEINALNAIRTSTETTTDAYMIITHAPCIECAYDIIDSSIKAVIFLDFYRCAKGIEKLLSRGISVYKVDSDDIMNNDDFTLSRVHHHYGELVYELVSEIL